MKAGLVKELSAEDQQLVKAALSVQKNAYAPYSKFLVGCALRDERGTIYTGCNVENASYSAVICAERTALTKMISEGGHTCSRMVVVTSSEQPVFPCGVCLQVIREFGDDVVVLALNGSATHFRMSSLKELYPASFSKENLDEFKALADRRDSTIARSE